MALTITPLEDFPIIRREDDLVVLIQGSLANTGLILEDNDIFVITQKIISKSEGRMVDLVNVTPTPRAQELAATTGKDPRLVELMLQESSNLVRVNPNTIIVEHRLGFICANAGIDHSNVAGEGNERGEFVLLLPEDPDKSAQRTRDGLQSISKKKLGIMIIDSHGRAWRNGTVGMCIGLSGIPTLVDERGWKDLFGYTLRHTVVGVADELAAAASLVMGQAAEGTPVVHVRGFPYPLHDGSFHELIRPRELDLFR